MAGGGEAAKVPANDEQHAGPAAGEQHQEHQETVSEGGAPLAAVTAAGGTVSRAAVLSVQRRAGNRAAVSVVRRQSGRRPTTRARVMRDGDDQGGTSDVPEWLQRKAQVIWEEVDGYVTDNERIIAALHSSTLARPESVRVQLDRAYRRLSGGQSVVNAIRSVMNSPLEGEDLVIAMAHYFGDGVGESHVLMARALWGPGTYIRRVHQLMEAPWASRQHLKRDYDRLYKRDAEISRGLVHDLHDDLSGWDLLETKSLLFHARLNDAERLYGFAVNGDGNLAGQLLRRLFAQDPTGHAVLDGLTEQWNARVVGQGWTGYTPPSVFLGHELDHDANLSVQGVFAEARQASDREFQRERGGADADDPGSSHGGDPATTRRERREMERLSARRGMAEGRLEGALAGMDDDEQEAMGAADDLRDAYARARRLTRDPDRRRFLVDQWRANVSSFEQRAETDLTDDEFEEFQFRLRHEPSKADEVYFKFRGGDYDAALRILDAAWGAGNLQELQRDARRDLWTGGRQGQGRRLRPPFDLVPQDLSSGSDQLRFQAMANPDPRAAAVQRMLAEIHDDDDVVTNIYEFLHRGGQDRAQAAVRAFVRGGGRQWVTRHASEHMGRGFTIGEGDTQLVNAFTFAVVGAYGRSTHAQSLFGLVAPAQDDASREARGRRAVEEAEGVVGTLADVVTGESHGRGAREDLERLRMASGSQRATPEQLEEMARFRGVEVSALGQAEYEALRQGLETWEQAKATTAEVVATCVEIGVEVALTALTGGTAGAALAASVASFAAGVATRELMRENEYEAISDANAQALINIVAGAGVGHAASDIYEAAAVARRLDEMLASGELAQRLGRADLAVDDLVRLSSSQQAAQSAVEALGTSVTEEMVQAAFAEIGVTDESIEAALERIASNALGANLNSRVKSRILGESQSFMRAWTAAIAGGWVNTMTRQTGRLDQAQSAETWEKFLEQHYLEPLLGRSLLSSTRGAVRGRAASSHAARQRPNDGP